VYNIAESNAISTPGAGDNASAQAADKTLRNQSVRG